MGRAAKRNYRVQPYASASSCSAHASETWSTRVAAGVLNKQIAAELGLSEVTVKVHRAKAMRKMHAKSLAELVRMTDNVQHE